MLLFAVLFHHIAASVAPVRSGCRPPIARWSPSWSNSRPPSRMPRRPRPGRPRNRSLADRRIGTIERLRLLALLTYAGIEASSAEAMIPWRLDQLLRTYDVTTAACAGLETDHIQELPPRSRKARSSSRAFPPATFARARPRRLRAYPALQRIRPTGVAVELEPMEGAYELTVVAQDRPALFASFAGAISSFGLNIVKAEAFSNSQGVILDPSTSPTPSAPSS